MSKEAEEKTEVPVIKWQRLEVSQGVDGEWCGAAKIAALQLPGGRVVPVALRKLPQHSPDAKVSGPCLKEAMMLRALSGIPGVPKLYGVTESPPYAMVMSRCRGETLDDLRRRGKIRCCLIVLQEVCGILGDVHKRGYYHGDVHAGNILLQFTNNHCCMLVTLDKFGSAGTLSDRTDGKEIDGKMLCILVKEVLLYMKKKDDAHLYNKRVNFIMEMEETKSLAAIYTMLHHLLYSLSTHRSSTPHFLSKHC